MGCAMSELRKMFEDHVIPLALHDVSFATALGLSEVYMLNDAHAHLLGAQEDMRSFSVLALSLGTSFNVALSDEHGAIMPHDLLHTTLFGGKAVYELRIEGKKIYRILAGQEARSDVDVYAGRVASVLNDVLLPRCDAAGWLIDRIALCGGVTEHNAQLKDKIGGHLSSSHRALLTVGIKDSALLGCAIATIRHAF